MVFVSAVCARVGNATGSESTAIERSRRVTVNVKATVVVEVLISLLPIRPPCAEPGSKKPVNGVSDGHLQPFQDPGLTRD